jgi:hypothetical protein
MSPARAGRIQIGGNEFIKKALYNFIKWQDNFPKKEKEDSK